MAERMTDDDSVDRDHSSREAAAVPDGMVVFRGLFDQEAMRDLHDALRDTLDDGDHGADATS